MCFSPEADVLVGAVVGGIGVDALRHARVPVQLPLAGLPVLFGVHQLSESFIWWQLRGDVAHSIGRAALWMYLIIALVVVPLVVPVTVLLVERSPRRRRIIAMCAVVAAAVAGVLLIAVVRGPLDAVIESHHIAYSVGALTRGGQLTALYVIATGGALLASGSRDLNAIGVLNLIVVPPLAWLTVNGFVSLWCFWAALVSILIAWHLRRGAGVGRSHLRTVG